MADELKNEFYEDYYKIVIEDIPLIDVRSPKEHKKGSFPNTVNLPLMNNEERHKVGLCYSESGHDAAVELGHKLVSGELKEKRIEKWVKFIEKNPRSILFCARGGLRSEITQKWIYNHTNNIVPRLKGGFKAFRNFFIKNLKPENIDLDFITLSGYTGSGKTILLNKLNNSIDLEGIANHRGSGFGNYINPQPTPINFENNLAAEIIKKQSADYKNVLIEDESRHIGRIFIRKSLFKFFSKSPVILLEVPIEKRVVNIFKEYVIHSQKKYIDYFGKKDGLDKWYNFISHSFDKVKKRLGGAKHKELTAILKNAYNIQIKNNDFKLHKKWIKGLLENYYDPLYDHHLKNLKREILFKGNFDEVLYYLKKSKV